MEREQPVVVEEADERERGKRSDRVERGRPDGRRHGKQIPMGETLTETAGLEKVAQRLAFRVRRLEQRGRLPIEAHDLAEQREVRRPRPDSAAGRRTRWRRGCCIRARSALHDTANDMSESRVATPSSPNSRTRFGYVRSLWTRKPVSSATVPLGPSTTTVLVWPPRRPSCSKRCTRCRRLSSEAAAKTRNARTDHSDVLHVPQEYQYPADSSSICP